MCEKIKSWSTDDRDVPILRAAKTNNIKTLTFVASWDNVWKMGRSNKANEPRENADTFVVWNSMMNDHLLRLYPEIGQHNISIIGAPRFDFFTHKENIPTKEDLRSFLAIPNDEGKLIHFATTELYPMEYLIKSIAKARDNGQLNYPVHLYASVHPGGDIAKHEKYANKYGVNVKYSFGRQPNSLTPSFKYNPSIENIYMLIALFKHSDLLINQSSTVALESFAADTPVINAKYGKSFDWWNWHRSAVAKDFRQHYADILKDSPSQVVYNDKELINATNAYLDHPTLDQDNRLKSLMRMTTIIDGTASKQLVKFIKKHANQQ